MQHQKRKKIISKKRKRNNRTKSTENYGYQPDNPVTVYYAKYIYKKKD
tara:strand:- start:2150 stop:2293 length:144 start_codon:yes stop_codon:yes gene_type:complete